MHLIWKEELPGDGPIFSGGPHFAFYARPPQTGDESPEADVTPDTESPVESVEDDG